MEDRMAKIRHVAIRATDTAKLAEFYKNALDLKEVGRGNITNGVQAIYLSDGYINLALLPARDGQREGIDHVGFEVEHLDKTARSAIASGARKPEESPKDGRFAEFFLYDLVGTRVDLSEHGWKVE
jgi:catechol 2,3-dioxygenase-like lactoylglutathione lyase family enzyme